MSKKIQLSIPKPCHENWDDMTPVQQGKFCVSCQKQVVDFSIMSDRQVAEFFKKPILSLSKGGSVCDRFMTDQLDRSIEIPKKRIPWIKYFFQFALPAFLLSIKFSAVKAQGTVLVAKSNKTSKKLVGEPLIEKCIKPVIGDTLIMPEIVITTPVKSPVPGQTTNLAKALAAKVSGPVVNVIHKPYEISGTRDLSKPTPVNLQHGLVGTVGMVSVRPDKDLIITGKVVDEKGEPVPFASIELGKAVQFIIADENGIFTIKKSQVKNGDSLLISSVGFESRTIIAGEENFVSGELYVQLKTNVVLQEVVLTTSSVISCGRQYRLGAVVKGQTITRTVKEENLVQKDKEPATGENKFLIYPNPVLSGGSLNLCFKKMEEGYYQIQIINLSGQMFLQKEIWIDAEAGLLSIDMPAVAAGSYFLALANKKSGNKFTEKIIVL